MADNYKYDLLLKEIDLINGNIKNLDDIIYKTKNFAFLFWGGSIYLIVNLDKSIENMIPILIALTAIIPMMFWTMDFRWRKHLLMASAREKIISQFINSSEFSAWLRDEKSAVKFPLYDPVGWIFTTGSTESKDLKDEYLTNPKAIGFLKILLYKDAKWYYLIMILISILFAFFYSSGKSATTFLF